MTALNLIENTAKMRLAMARFMVKNRCDEATLLEALINNAAVLDAFRAGAKKLGGGDELILSALKDLGLQGRYMLPLESSLPTAVEPLVNITAIQPTDKQGFDATATITGQGAVLTAMQALRYKEDEIDVANPIKYLYSRFGVHPDDATQEQLVEALSAARIAVLNTASNAKSEFRSKRLSNDEIIAIVNVSSTPFSGPRKAQLDALKDLIQQIQQEKGEYWNTTSFLKKEKMSTELHYGKDHTTNKVAGFVDNFFKLS